MANGVNDVLITTINEIGWAMIDKNKKQAQENIYKDILVASLVGGFNIANSYFIAASLKGNPENIYKTTGIGFGVVLGISTIIGNTTKGSPSVSIDGKDYYLGLNKGVFKVITHILLSKVLTKFISPITKIVQKLISPLLKLPKYADIFNNINGNVNAGKGKAKEMFLRFILWLFIGALGTVIAIKLLIAYRNKLNPKDVTRSKGFMDIGAMRNTTIGAPNIQQALKISKTLEYKPEFFSEFSKKSANAIKLSGLSSAAENKSSIDLELDSLFTELKSITNGKIHISVSPILKSDEQRINVIRAIKSIIPGVKTTTDVADFKFKSVNIVIFNASTISVDNIGIYNAAMNVLTGDAYMMFYPTKDKKFQLTNDEVAAVMLHECGHYLTRQNSFVYINTSLSLLTFPASLFVQPVTQTLVFGSFNHMIGVYGRYQEIQADKYATQLGYGNELASALAKLYQIHPKEISRLDNKDNSDVHSTLKLRYDALKKYASDFKKKK